MAEMREWPKKGSAVEAKQPDKSRAGLALLAFLIAYFAFEAVFVSLISPGAGLDDAELISNISFWNWGYGGSQPPLYTWVAYGLTQIFGLHFVLLQFLRFGLLGSGIFAVYLGLRQLRVAAGLAAFGALAIFLLPQIGWESQRALIHSVLGTAGSAWSFAAFTWFICRPGYGRALALGLAIMAAILGKYNGLIFISALFMAGFILPQSRRALLNLPFIAAIIAALVFMSPALIFMIAHPKGVMQRAEKFHSGASSFWTDRLHGLADLIGAAVNFVLPLLALALILALIVRLRQKRAAARAQETQAPAADSAVVPGNFTAAANAEAMRFLGAILLSGLLIWAVIVLFSGATNIKDRWLQPVLFLAPAYAVLALARLDLSRRAPRALGIIAVIAACAVPPALYVNLYHRSAARPIAQNLDYPLLYTKLRANGRIATILAPDPFYAGNLRLLHPRIKTLFAETPYAAERLKRPLVLLWSRNKPLPAALLPILAQAGLEKNLPPIQRVQIPYRNLNGDKAVSAIMSYIYLP